MNNKLKVDAVNVKPQEINNLDNLVKVKEKELLKNYSSNKYNNAPIIIFYENVEQLLAGKGYYLKKIKLTKKGVIIKGTYKR